MTVTIENLGVVVAGAVIRKYDQGANRTTLTVTLEQARSLHADLAKVLEFFDTQDTPPPGVS